MRRRLHKYSEISPPPITLPIMYLDSLTNAPPSPREQAQSPAPASPAPAKKATLDNATREELVVFVKKQAAKMKGLEKKSKGHSGHK